MHPDIYQIKYCRKSPVDHVVFVQYSPLGFSCVYRASALAGLNIPDLEIPCLLEL